MLWFIKGQKHDGNSLDGGRMCKKDDTQSESIHFLLNGQQIWVLPTSSQGIQAGKQQAFGFPAQARKVIFNIKVFTNPLQLIQILRVFFFFGFPYLYIQASLEHDFFNLSPKFWDYWNVLPSQFRVKNNEKKITCVKDEDFDPLEANTCLVYSLTQLISSDEIQWHPLASVCVFLLQRLCCLVPESVGTQIVQL